MNSLMLFAETELPAVPKFRSQGQRTLERLAAQRVSETLKCLSQLSFDFFTKKNRGRRAKTSNKRKLEWGAVAFTGSITINNLRTVRNESNAFPEISNALIWEMHRWVFEESIEALKAFDNSEEKIDILEWIFSPLYIEKAAKSLDGRPCLIRRHASDIPFSYFNCCRAVGITDSDTFREMLVEQMNDEIRPKLERYLHVTTGWNPNNSRKAKGNQHAENYN